VTPTGRPAPVRALRTALQTAGGAGPFFALEFLDEPAGPSWIPVAELTRDDVTKLVTSTARQLGTAQTRVAASIAQQGLAARLWSPVLGCALLRGVIPDLTPLLVTIEPALRLGLARLAGWRAGESHEVARLAALTVSAQLSAFAALLPVRLPDGLLRGNSGSAAAGALGVMARYRPDLGGPAAALGRELTGTTELAGTGEFTSGLAFRRRSCCLYYRTPAGGLCGDCCHEVPPDGTA
jgi:FhuF 2Fe-2S C-terminal domain